MHVDNGTHRGPDPASRRRSNMDAASDHERGAHPHDAVTPLPSPGSLVIGDCQAVRGQTGPAQATKPDTPGFTAATAGALWPVRLRVALHHEGRRYRGDYGQITRSAAAVVSAELTSRLGAGWLEAVRIDTADIDVASQDPAGCPVTVTATADLTLLIGADTSAGAHRMAIPVLRLRLFHTRVFTADFASARHLTRPQTALSAVDESADSGGNTLPESSACCVGQEPKQ